MNTNYPEMGARIRLRRKELHLTQYQLAEKLNISNNHLSSIENGKQAPSLDMFIRICDTLDTRPDYLLLGSVHADNVPQNIMDNLLLCNEKDLGFIDHMIEYMVKQNRHNWNKDSK